MNILFVTFHTCPLDLKSRTGGAVRSMSLWEAMQKINPNGGNYMLSVKGENSPVENDKMRYFKIDEQLGFSSYSKMFRWGYKKFAGLGYLPKRVVKEYAPETYFPGVKFDCIIVRFQVAACIYPYYKVAPTILDYDDHPIEKFESVTRHSINAFVWPFAQVYNKLLFYEVRRHIAGGFLSDNKYVDAFGYNVSYLPNVVPEPSASYNVCQEDRKYLFTIGVMGYAPNCHGVDYFLRCIWPDFHKKYPNVSYVIGGDGAAESYKKRWSMIEGVYYLGFVDDLDKAYENCMAAVVPIWEGSGTAIKTREAMIHSRCCLTTPFGTRGLENMSEVENNGVFVFDSPEDFIKAYENIAKPTLLSGYEKNVYRYAKKYFSQKQIELTLMEKIKGIIK